MILTILLLFAIVVMSFFLANAFRLKNIYTGSDAYFHYQAAEQIRGNRFHLYDQIEVYSIKSPPDYPPLIHYLLSLLPPSKLLSYGRFIGSIFDALNKILVFFIGLLLFNDAFVSLLAVIVYASIVLVSQEQIEASPRPMGSFFFSVHLLALYQYMINGGSIYLFVAMFCVFLAYITHRFAFQTIFLVDIFLSLFFRNFIFTIVFVGGIILSIVLLRHHFFLLLKSMTKTYEIWFKMRNAKKAAKKGYSKWFISLAECFLFNFIDLLVIGLVFFLNYELPESLWLFFVVLIFLRCVQLAVFTTKYLRCIGEHFRYLAYSAMPTSLCFSYLIYHYRTNSYTIILAALSVLASFAILFLWQREYRKSKFLFPDKGTIASLEKIKKFTTDKLLILDYQYARNVGFLTKKKVFFTLSQQYFHVVKDILWPSKDINDVIRELGITDVLIHSSVASRYLLTNVRKVYKDNFFTLYKVGIHNN